MRAKLFYFYYLIAALWFMSAMLGNPFAVIPGALYMALGAGSQVSAYKSRPHELSAEEKYQEWLWAPDKPMELPKVTADWFDHAVKDMQGRHRKLAQEARRHYAEGDLDEADFEKAIERAFDTTEIQDDDPAWVSIFGTPRENLEKQIKGAFRTPPAMILEGGPKYESLDSIRRGRSYHQNMRQIKSMIEYEKAKEQAKADFGRKMIRPSYSSCNGDHIVAWGSRRCRVCFEEVV